MLVIYQKRTELVAGSIVWNVLFGKGIVVNIKTAFCICRTVTLGTAHFLFNIIYSQLQRPNPSIIDIVPRLVSIKLDSNRLSGKASSDKSSFCVKRICHFINLVSKTVKYRNAESTSVRVQKASPHCLHNQTGLVYYIA